MRKGMTRRGFSFLEMERREKQRRKEDLFFVGSMFLFTAYVILSLLFGGR